MELLYNIFIMPIELLVEITYSVMESILNNCGLAIIAVSLVIQTLILPLYKRADAIQDEERIRQEKMSHWVSHIKKTFKGDERFMMLSTYYRQQGYKSWYPLKSSVAILLQIPFFIAAYHYLSNLEALSGQTFLFIRDLGEPDSIVTIVGFPINILPVIMTGFNMVSGMIYTKGQRVRDKVQVYGLAVIFLVLLYNSPSGLVLYWTMNNLYSMMKNVFMKILAGRISLPGVKRWKIMGCFHDSYNRRKNPDGGVWGTYCLEAVFMTLFCGGMVALNVLNASPAEFITGEYGPVRILINNLSVFFGIFMVWGTIFFALMKPFTRFATTVVLFAVLLVSCADYMFFGTSLGTLTSLLNYEVTIYFSRREIFANCLLVAFVFMVCIYVALRWSIIQRRIIQILTMAVAIIVLVKGVSLKISEDGLMSLKEANGDSASNGEIIHLSKSGNNVIVFMLDRAISGYIPFIFNEKPEIQEAFEGFTYYPNTLSFGAMTNFAAPSLFGGYEYTPTEMDKRTDESLKDKNDEALRVLPKLFSDAGYSVTVCSPPYAGYKWIPDLSIYDDIENVSAYDPCGWYTDDELIGMYSMSDYIGWQQKHFFYYSSMKVLPVAIQPYIYGDGTYLSQEKASVRKDFMDNYSTLTHLTEMTQIEDDDSDNVLIMQNSTTHDETLLKTPEYVPVDGISTSGYMSADIDAHIEYLDGESMELLTQYQTAHYHVNVAALTQLSEWFEYLKDNDCWDNTRIILVSDHGRNLGQFDNMKLSNGIDVESYNPLLMVKDFDAMQYTVSDEFMTNADVPSLALSGLVENPTNPYTGNPITTDAKEGDLFVTTSENYDVLVNNGNIFDTSDGEWYRVGYNIFDEENWIKIE
jgi:YidC/Oxa1 family membrane protein insertase